MQSQCGVKPDFGTGFNPPRGFPLRGGLDGLRRGLFFVAKDRMTSSLSVCNNSSSLFHTQTHSPASRVLNKASASTPAGVASAAIEPAARTAQTEADAKGRTQPYQEDCQEEVELGQTLLEDIAAGVREGNVAAHQAGALLTTGAVALCSESVLAVVEALSQELLSDCDHPILWRHASASEQYFKPQIASNEEI